MKLVTFFRNHPILYIAISTILGIVGALLVGAVLEQFLRIVLGLPLTLSNLWFNVVLLGAIFFASLGTFLVAGVFFLTTGALRVWGVIIVFLVPILVEIIDLCIRVIAVYEEVYYSL